MCASHHCLDVCVYILGRQNGLTIMINELDEGKLCQADILTLTLGNTMYIIKNKLMASGICPIEHVLGMI